MKTSVTELPGSRAKVDVEVPPDVLDRHVQRAARGMAREMRLPGFRGGKAPPSLVIQRLGYGTVFEQALRDSLAEWYEQALLSAGVNPVGDPSIEVTKAPEAQGDPLSFEFEVGVRPGAKLGEYRGIEVGRADPDVPDDVIESEIERMREAFARLDPVDRAAATGDVLLVDFDGTVDGEPFEGGEARDHMLELGSDRLIPGFEEGLTGVQAGETREVTVTFPEDHRNEALAGKEGVIAVQVKEVREKILPDLDDDFASDASEFENLDELREDIRSKLSEAAEKQIDEDFRLAAIDAAADNATVEMPDDIITARATERWERIERQLQGQGIDPATYLQVQGRTREELIDESRPDAERELRREAVLTAIAEAEDIEVSEEEMIEALAHTAEHERTSPEQLLERLRRDGRDGLVREDLRVRKAIDIVAESAKPIPMAQAEAREKLWTPEGERPAADAGGGGLWTPGSGDPEPRGGD